VKKKPWLRNSLDEESGQPNLRERRSEVPRAHRALASVPKRFGIRTLAKMPHGLLSSKLIPVNEFHIWFVSQHLVEIPAVIQTGSASA
jgi:hypothetical protein